MKNKSQITPDKTESAREDLTDEELENISGGRMSLNPSNTDETAGGGGGGGGSVATAVGSVTSSVGSAIDNVGVKVGGAVGSLFGK